jgi:hypothetical protein
VAGVTPAIRVSGAGGRKASGLSAASIATHPPGRRACTQTSGTRTPIACPVAPACTAIGMPPSSAASSAPATLVKAPIAAANTGGDTSTTPETNRTGTRSAWSRAASNSAVS